MENGTACYVCLEPCDTPSPCACKNLYVHVACQVQWIETSQTTHCSVCHAAYANVVVLEERAPLCSVTLCAVLMVHLTAVSACAFLHAWSALVVYHLWMCALCVMRVRGGRG